MKTRLSTYVWALLLLVLSNACQKEDGPDYTPVWPFANGAFISNEGTFGQANASVSYYDYAGDSVTNNIFYTVNGHPLGQVLQSMHATGGKVYMVLNLSDTVVVANGNDFKETGIITGLSSPRYMTSYNGKGYITQWGENGVVKVVDLSTNGVIKTIVAGTGPEQAIVASGRVLVCNGGAYDVDSTVTVIDPATDQVVKTIVVGDNPKEMVVDRNGDIWVLCYGYIKYDGSFQIILETPSKLTKLSGQSFQKIGEYTIAVTKHPQHIDISADKSMVYYGGGFGFAGIYAMRIDATATPSIPLVDGSKFFYGFNVNPSNGDIYALDATDFTTPGILGRYTAQGSLVKEYMTGVGPNGAIFR